MKHQSKNLISYWWNSRKITEKFGAVFLLLLFISGIQSIVSISAFRVIGKSAESALASLDTQRLSLEMSRDWESMRNYEYRFFSQFPSIGFTEAKEHYALPAGEKLSDIIRTGAALRRLTTAPDASDNLKSHNALLQQFLSELSKYASELESAVQLAADSTTDQTENIKAKRENLDILAESIKPLFTRLILMTQNEVIFAQEKAKDTQQSVILFLILANLLGFVLVGVILLVFRKVLSGNVSDLTRASARIQAGHWDERVKISSVDEFGVIGTAFNQMVNSIQERTYALREIEFRYQALFNQSNDAVFLIGLDGKILKANQRALSMYGYSPSEISRMNIQEMVADEEKKLAYQSLEKLVSGTDLPVFEYTMCKSDGSTFPVEISFTRVLNELGEPLYFQSVSRDISERKKVEEQLRFMAMYDPLTGLPNRTHLYAYLEKAMFNADREQHMLAVFFMDLDGFKQVNDSFGHEQGDQLLKLVGQKLMTFVRQSDLVARVGGDEFIIVLEVIHKKQDAALVAEKIINNLSEPFQLEAGTVQISTSLGISLYSDHGEKIETLIQQADQAMYQIKGETKNGYKFFEKH
ncbi:MAG: hypothetical protein CL609_21920 [Anaerolineaceae bacterium]|nr:hypothetical protein [Anaerolineaceae bacterium]